MTNDPYSSQYNFRSDNSFYQKSGEYCTLLVVFNYWGQSTSIRAHSQYLDGVESNKLFLHSGANDWFQNGIPGIANSFAELVEFAKSIRKYFVEKRIIYIGCSMGAFAALACGIASGAERILVSNPEIELGLPGSMSDTYLDKAIITYPSIAHFLERNSVQIDCLFGYKDPHDRNVAHIMSAYDNINIHMLDCGHEVFPYLRDKKILADVFRELTGRGELESVLSSCYSNE